MVEFRAVAQAGALMALAAGASAAQAELPKVNMADWQFAHDVIGQTSTATVVAGGNPIYVPNQAQYRSTVGILMDYGAAGAFVCSGTLINATSVVTAAHCVSDGGKDRPLSTTVFFNSSDNDIAVYANQPGTVTRSVGYIAVNKLYTGQVVDQNDIAVLRLNQAAPDFVTPAKLSDLNDLTGLDHIIAGYGSRSTSGGTNGTLGAFGLGVGRLRYAGNRFDFRFGDPDFEGYFDNAFGGADTNHVWISDFDNGTAFRDNSCNLASFESAGAPGIFSKAVFSSSKYCDQGLGAFEGIGAGGDSGGSYFVDGKLVAVHSFALWYRDDESANRFGQFKGAVPIYLHRDFIAGAVPEPSSWALLIAGFGLTGATMRRRRVAAA
nr:trypsin-like serine protease [Sandarakinorhabdus oryzae]